MNCIQDRQMEKVMMLYHSSEKNLFKVISNRPTNIVTYNVDMQSVKFSQKINLISLIGKEKNTLSQIKSNDAVRIGAKNGDNF